MDTGYGNSPAGHGEKVASGWGESKQKIRLKADLVLFVIMAGMGSSSPPQLAHKTSQAA
jgi:hypothetical protein